MDNEFFDSTRVASYFLWENAGGDDALGLWYAAEDIACFFEQANILEAKNVDSIIEHGLQSEGYIWFLRNIAYRLYLYTGNDDHLSNWFTMEKLIRTPPWVESVTRMAAILSAKDGNVNEHIRSDHVRSFYGNTNHFDGSQTF